MSWLTEELKSECDYHEDKDGPVDNMIAYKDALEGLLNRIDVVATQNARGKCSAADAMGDLFSMSLGNLTVPELRTAGLLEGEY